MSAKSRRLWFEVMALLLVLAVAAFFRFAQLDTIPPGMTHDEAAFGAEAEKVLAGEWPIYFALGYGHEPLYAYLVAAAFAIGKHTLLTMRVVAVLIGMLVVVGTYVVARRMFGVRVAWVATAWMAVAFWPVSISRQALRGYTLPMLWLPATLFFWQGVDALGDERGGETSPGYRRAMVRFVISGALIGVTFYAYLASRVSWLVYPIFVVYALLFHRRRVGGKWLLLGTGLMLGISAILAAPLAAYLLAHPGIEVRMSGMLTPLRELLAGRPERVLRHVWDAVRVFSWVGDPFWVYNIPGRPIFGPLGSLFFYLGLLMALWRWHDMRYAFLLIWFGVGMVPALLTTNEGIFWRALIAQPATYILLADGVRGVGEWLGGILPRYRWLPWATLAVGLVVVGGMRDYHAYFVDWPNRPQARNIYNCNMVEIARYVRAEPVQSTLGISALYPLYYHDPFILRYASGRADLRTRWFDGRGGIVYPAEGEGRYIFSALTRLDPALRDDFVAHATLVERRELRRDDQNPYFEVWEWHGGQALEESLGQSPMWVSPETEFTHPEWRQSLKPPVHFGTVMALIGYRANGREFRPGDVLEMVIYWRALKRVEEQDDWVTFVHLLDQSGQWIAGVDVLNCPPTGWYPGDVAAQVYRLRVPNDISPGEKMVEVGVYRRSVGRRSVLVGGHAVGDRVLLSPVRVKGGR